MTPVLRPRPPSLEHLMRSVRVGKGWVALLLERRVLERRRYEIGEDGAGRAAEESPEALLEAPCPGLDLAVRRSHVRGPGLLRVGQSWIEMSGMVLVDAGAAAASLMRVLVPVGIVGPPSIW